MALRKVGINALLLSIIYTFKCRWLPVDRLVLPT